LSANDSIVAIDGIRASSEGLAATLARAAPGTRLAIDAFRRDVLMHFDVVLEAAPDDTAFLTLTNEIGKDMLQRRVAWLGA